MILYKIYNLILPLLLLHSASCQILESVDGVSETAQKDVSIHIPKLSDTNVATITITIEDTEETDIQAGEGLEEEDDNENQGKIYFAIFHPNQVPAKMQNWAVKTTQETASKNICFKEIDKNKIPIRVSIFSDSPMKKKVSMTIESIEDGVCETSENSTTFSINIDDDDSNTEEYKDTVAGSDNIGLIVVVVVLVVIVMVLGGREGHRLQKDHTASKRIEGDEEHRRSKPIFTGKNFPMEVDAEKGGTPGASEMKPLAKDQNQEANDTEKVEDKEVKQEETGDIGMNEDEMDGDEEDGEIEMKEGRKKLGHLGADFPQHFQNKHIHKKF